MATGHLGAITFNSVAGAGTSLNIISITPAEESNTPIAVPYLSLAKGSNIPYEEGELNEGGEYDIETADDNNTQIVDATGTTTGTVKAILRKLATCVWTKPPAAGLTNGATRSFSGILISAQDGQQITGSRNTTKIKIKVAGNMTKTPGS